MAGEPLQFWFDFGSTYSYLAALRIDPLATAAGVALEWKPFLLGPLFRRQGWNDSPFNLNPVRGRYMWRDIERSCRRLGLPFKRPTQFPRNGLLAARVACLAEGRGWIPAFTRDVFRANFAEDRDIADPAVIGAILDRLGEDGAGLTDGALAPDNKERLRRQTEQAWDLGIFGAPSLIAASELFWGNDRLEEALSWLATVERGG